MRIYEENYVHKPEATYQHRPSPKRYLCCQQKLVLEAHVACARAEGANNEI